jgi:hypothetical protein
LWTAPPAHDAPVPARRRLPITPVVTEIRIDVAELARSAGLEARLEELREPADPRASAEAFQSLAAALDSSVRQQLSSGSTGHARAVIEVSAGSADSDLQLAQSIVSHTRRQVALTVSGVRLAEFCPPVHR